MSVVNDLRALGSTAPVRAAYEASKRSGFHSVLFSGAGRHTEMTPAPLALTRTDPRSDAAVERALADAQLIVSEGLRVFGRRARTGVAAPWSQDPDTGELWPQGISWWKIDIRSDQRLGDVKFVWEAARHRDLVVLARAARVQPEGGWAAELDRLLSSWCAQNPPERGVNWYSSLELALRAIAWAQILELARDQLSARTVAAMGRQLSASARHLMVELPYTVSSMRNNHLLGDALGLLVLARLFPESGGAARWTRLGNRLFSAQLARHMRADGSMIEDSLSYHRFVLEMLIVRTMLGDAPAEVHDAMRGAATHLARIGVFEGEVPQYGDWDEGRVLASSGDALDVAGSAALALSLSGERVPADWFDRFDELAWYAAPDAPRGDLAVGRRGASAVSGGIAYVAEGPWRVWFKCGGGPSHGHADLTSVFVQRDHQWLLADPGTGTYNGPLEIRNSMRVSASHPVMRIDGESQLLPHRAFRWLGHAAGHVAPVARIGGRLVLLGWHDAYERLSPGLRVARLVVVDASSVSVVDLLSPEATGHRWDLTLQLADSDVPVAGLTDSASTPGTTSPTYGTWDDAAWPTTSGGDRAFVWQLGDGPAVKVETAGRVSVGDLTFDTTWDHGVAVEVTFEGRTSLIMA